MKRVRKCELSNCNEIATRKVYFKRTVKGQYDGELRNLCQGHAFILLGATNSDEILVCPICLTHFQVECLDGKKKIERE